MVPRRALLLVDGEHHPPRLREAIRALEDEGVTPLLAVVAGGGEKLADPSRAPDLSLPVVVPASAEDALPDLLAEHDPEVVLDLSGEPVVTPTRRLRLAAVVLAAGLDYRAPGVTWSPPELTVLTRRPTVAMVATGKRTGKTAMSGALVRHAAARGRRPVVVAMGRGGPPEPVVLEAGRDLSPAALLAVVAEGDHAASDFYEDAVTTGATTVGCFRVGDGPAGQVGYNNVRRGISMAEEQPGDLTVLEGSGAALPPALPDAVALIVPATADLRDLAAALPLRQLFADLVLVTLAAPPSADREQVTAVRAAVEAELTALPVAARPLGGETPRIVTTRFVPRPLGDVSDRRVLLVTTAPEPAAHAMARTVGTAHDAEVVAVSNALADRPRLREDLEAAPDHDTVLVELKAAAVDVVMRHADEHGREVVVMDHQAVTLEGEPPLADCFDGLLELAGSRHAERGA